MKAGFATSLALHTVVLGFGLVSLSAPRPLEVADVEAFPVDIVPMEEIAQSVTGEKEAPAEEKPTPLPTERKDVVENATTVGENEVDLETPPTPDPKPRPVETAAVEPPASEPAPQPEPEPEPEPEPQEAPPEPVPATEVTPEPQPKQEVAPEPAPESAVAEAPEAESVSLPENAPTPAARPQPPQAQTAKAPERKDSERPAQPTETAKSPSEEKSLEDQVAALLNRADPSGGGAERSTEQASLGGSQTTGVELSQSEMDALRAQIQRCWNVPAGAADAENLRVSVQFRLDQAGALDGMPQVVDGGGGSGIELAAAESARRAVLACAPYTMPTEKYDAWSDVIVHFDPRDMF